MEHNTRRGAPRKSSRGLKQILFVRVDDTLLPLLDKLVVEEQKTAPSRTVTRAEVVRDLIYKALQQRGIQ